jgi:long-subunit acyl-CoA synthetase (AMP-forming)
LMRDGSAMKVKEASGERIGAVDSGQASTLTAWLDLQAQTRPGAVCLRQKVRGRWYARTWRQAANEVVRLSAGLAALGLGRGDALVVVGDPNVEALLVVLAALRLGGNVLPLSPRARFEGSRVAQARRQFAVVERSEQLDRLLSAAESWLPSAVVCIDERGVVPGGGVRTVSYKELVHEVDESEPASGVVRASEALPDDAAFCFPFASKDGERSPLPISHREALAGAARLLESAAIDAEHHALVPRSLSPDVARSFVGAWLSAGFCLSFPEKASTRDVDRHELAPSLVVGTAESYDRLRERVVENLPEPGSLLRSLVDWALGPSTHGLDEALRATVGHVLVRRPLREIIGFSRVKLALIDGHDPAERALAFFSRLGLELRPLSGVLAGVRGVEPPCGLLSTVAKEAS